MTVKLYDGMRVWFPARDGGLRTLRFENDMWKAYDVDGKVTAAFKAVDLASWLEDGSYALAEPEPKTNEHDAVAHPKHYTAHPSGVECIRIAEHMGFNLGNAVKYIWRCDLKQDAIEDIKKAIWYLQRELARRERAANL